VLHSRKEIGGVTESLLSASGPDFTLQSILSHIAYVNQTALDYRLSRKLSRRNQVRSVRYILVIVKWFVIRMLVCYGWYIHQLIRVSPLKKIRCIYTHNVKGVLESGFQTLVNNLPITEANRLI